MRRVLEYRGSVGPRGRGIGALASDCRVVGGILWVATLMEGVGVLSDLSSGATPTWGQAGGVGSVIISGVLGSAYVVAGQRLKRSGRAGVRGLMRLAVLHGVYWGISLGVSVFQVLLADDMGAPLLTLGALGVACLLMGLPVWIGFWCSRELRGGCEVEMQR